MMVFRFLKASAFSLVLGMSLMVSAISASAQSISDTEMKEVNESLEQYNELFNDSKEFGDMPELDYTLDDNGENNVYKSYIIDNYIVDAYNQNAGFDSVISDEYRIFAESGNQLVTMIKKGGKLVVVDGKMLDDDKKCINFEDEAKKIINKSNEKIKDLKFAKSSPLYLDLIYFRTESGEFVVPYFDCVFDSISKVIDNGKVYPVDEFVGRLNCIIDTSNCNKPGMYGGGAFRAEPLEYSANNSTSENSNMTYAIATVLGTVLLVSASYLTVRLVRKKHNNNIEC